MRTKKLVERVLDLKPEARDNDKLLMLYVWQMQGLHFSKGQIEAFKNASSPESIRRTRQKLQEEGKYLPSEEVEEKRYELYTETRQAINKAPEAVSWLAE